MLTRLYNETEIKVTGLCELSLVYSRASNILEFYFLFVSIIILVIFLFLMQRHNNLSENMYFTCFQSLACHSFAILTAALEHHQLHKFVKPDDHIMIILYIKSKNYSVIKLYI